MANISVRPRALQDIIVPYLPSGQGRPRDLNRLAAFFISHFYLSRTGDSYAAENLVGAMVGYLLTILTPEPIVDQDTLKESLQTSGINVDFVAVSPREIKLLMQEEPRCQDLIDRIGHWATIQDNDDVWACLGGIILLTIGKQVNPDGYNNWFTKRCTPLPDLWEIQT